MKSSPASSCPSSEPVEMCFAPFTALLDDEQYVADDDALEGLSTKDVGRLGELLAASYLLQCGYDVVQRNYRCPEGEADLIVYDEEDDAVVLVEVKTRRRHADAEDCYPEESVTPKKQRRYRRIASCYIMEHFPTPAVRFDVIAVWLCDGCAARIEHIMSAFDWDADR